VSAPEVTPEVSTMPGAEALPRDNGELVFAAPWEGRALALAIAVVQSLQLPWDEFRSRLVAEIAAQPERPYYESWLAALERLLRERGILGQEQLGALAAAEASARAS
jgi:nitrile hydratase accessory protein